MTPIGHLDLPTGDWFLSPGADRGSEEGKPEQPLQERAPHVVLEVSSVSGVGDVVGYQQGRDHNSNESNQGDGDLTARCDAHFEFDEVVS